MKLDKNYVIPISTVILVGIIAVLFGGYPLSFFIGPIVATIIGAIIFKKTKNLALLYISVAIIVIVFVVLVIILAILAEENPLAKTILTFPY